MDLKSIGISRVGSNPAGVEISFFLSFPFCATKMRKRNKIIFRSFFSRAQNKLAPDESLLLIDTNDKSTQRYILLQYSYLSTVIKDISSHNL